jgi:uncharacterized membrane protein
MSQIAGYLWKRVVACFLAGLFAVLPLVVTVGIAIWVTSFVERFIGPETFLGGRLRNLGVGVAGEGAETIAYVIGWFVVLLTIFCLGILLEFGANPDYS